MSINSAVDRNLVIRFQDTIVFVRTTMSPVFFDSLEHRLSDLVWIAIHNRGLGHVTVSNSGHPIILSISQLQYPDKEYHVLDTQLSKKGFKLWPYKLTLEA
ncbi:hypothetical protein GEMRC1_002697 [Eukaryota sp. GEM-RC1]